MSDKFSKYKSAPSGPVATPMRAAQPRTPENEVEEVQENPPFSEQNTEVDNGGGYTSPAHHFSTFGGGRVVDDDARSVTSERSTSPTGSECSDISNASSTTRRRRKVVHVQSRFMTTTTASSAAKKKATSSRTEKPATSAAPSASKARPVQSRVGSSVRASSVTREPGSVVKRVGAPAGGRSLGETLASVSSARKTIQTKERVVQSRFMNAAATPSSTPSRAATRDTLVTPTRGQSSEVTPQRTVVRVPKTKAEQLETPRQKPDPESGMVTPKNTEVAPPSAERAPRSAASAIYGSSRAPRSKSVTAATTREPSTSARPKKSDAEGPPTTTTGMGAASTYSNMAHEYSVLQTELLQWCFVNARAISAFEQQRKAAEQSMYDVWKDVTSRQEHVAQMKMRSLKEKHIKALDGLLKMEYESCRNFEDHASRFVGDYEQLCQALRLTMHRLPMNNATAEPKALVEALKATDMGTRSVQSEIQPLLGEVVTFANTFGTLEKAVKEEVAELTKCRELLNAFSHLEREERSLIIHKMQAGAAASVAN